MPSVLDREWWTQTGNTIERGPETIARRTAEALYAVDAITFRVKESDEPIPHRSGIEAPIYINCRKLFGPPESRSAIQSLLGEFARVSKSLHFDVVAGVDSAGKEPALSLANALFMPYAWVRKEAKGHGEKRQVEGADIQGRHALVVEDVVNLGTSSLPAVEAVRKEGATVTDVMAIVTYGYTKTQEQFREAGVRLHTLTDVPTIVAVGVSLKKIEQVDADKVLMWLREQDKNNTRMS